MKISPNIIRLDFIQYCGNAGGKLAVFPTLGNDNFTIIVTQINSPFKVHHLKDFAQRHHFQNDCYHCTFRAANQTCKYEIGDSAKDISPPIFRDLNHLEALAETVFDYCLMTKSAFIRLVLSSVCLDLVMEGGYLGTQYSLGTQFAYIDVYISPPEYWSGGVLCGCLIFHSDFVRQYTTEKHFKKMFNKSTLIYFPNDQGITLKTIITHFKLQLYLFSYFFSE